MENITNGSNDAGWYGIYEWYRAGERERERERERDRRWYLF
jgi:hypothetical protein